MLLLQEKCGLKPSLARGPYLPNAQSPPGKGPQSCQTPQRCLSGEACIWPGTETGTKEPGTKKRHRRNGKGCKQGARRQQHAGSLSSCRNALCGCRLCWSYMIQVVPTYGRRSHISSTHAHANTPQPVSCNAGDCAARATTSLLQ